MINLFGMQKSLKTTKLDKSITDVDEIGSILAGHTEPKVPPESTFLPYHLKQKEQRKLF